MLERSLGQNLGQNFDQNSEYRENTLNFGWKLSFAARVLNYSSCLSRGNCFGGFLKKNAG